MNSQFLFVTHWAWEVQAGRYESTTRFRLHLSHGIQFSGIGISFEASVPISDPADKSAAIVLRKLGPLQRKLHVLERRLDWQSPKAYVIGGTIMCQSDFFYFSNLQDFEYVRIYNGDPDEHPEFVEIVTQALGGDNADQL
jgi:hypothetical protein